MKALRLNAKVLCSVVVPLAVVAPLRGAVWYVNAAATPPGNGSSWATAWSSLQTALTSPNVHSGDEIWVAAR